MLIKRMSGTGGDDSHIRRSSIVRFMAEEDGFAAPEWQYGGSMGPAPPVVLVRKDRVPFSRQDWEALDTYIQQWMDEAAEAEDSRSEVCRHWLTAASFQTFLRSCRDSWPAACLSVQFPRGSIVVANGLSVEELNGKEGIVVQYSRERVGVKYPDRDPTALKPERLTLVREESIEPAAKRLDVGRSKEAQEKRQADVARKETLQIARRFVESLHQDTFPEMDDLHLFGIGCNYRARAQEALGVWQGAVKSGDITEAMLAEALAEGSVKELFMKTCRELANSRTPNAPYAKTLVENNFAALEWDEL